MKKFLKWLGILAGVFIFLIVLGVGLVYGISNAKLSEVQEITPYAIPIPTDSASIAHGRHIALSRGCADCHSADFGGAVVIDNPAIGVLAGSNLTSGKGSATLGYSNTDWVRAIRHGLRPDGSPLLLMPSDEYWQMSDEDCGALVAYLQTLEPVDREIASCDPGPIARLLYLTGEMPLVTAERIDHAAERKPPPPYGPTAQYGEYLVRNCCVGCHGQELSGGVIPGGDPEWPPAANLTPHKENGLGTWVFEDFRTAMREAKRPDGTNLNTAMPRSFGLMHDEELQAVWAYLRTAPSKEFGNR